MNLRTKSAALVAALALSLTLTGGIASADSTAGASTSANLLPKSDGAVGCMITVSSGQSIPFGNFTWTGSTYTGAPGSGTISLTRTDDRTPTPNCSVVQVKGTGLSSATTLQEAFPVGAVKLGNQGLTGVNTPLAADTGRDKTINITVTLDAEAINHEAAPATDYQGSITFTQATGV